MVVAMMDVRPMGMGMFNGWMLVVVVVIFSRLHSAMPVIMVRVFVVVAVTVAGGFVPMGMVMLITEKNDQGEDQKSRRYDLD